MTLTFCNQLITPIIQTGFTDVVTNGSVGIDGTGEPSVSHVNGNNIDFKYLRNDEKRPRIDIKDKPTNDGVINSNSTILDKSRQNELIDAFYLFGFARENNGNKKCLSHYLSDGSKLNYCNIEDHHKDHLHIQGFIAQYK